MIKKKDIPGFRKWMIVGGHIYSFFFTRNNQQNDLKFYVAVVDHEQNLISFKMQENEKGKWSIIDKEKMPFWLHDLEEILSTVIKEEII